MSTADDEVRVVLITAPDADSGAALARALVNERLAACVNLVPGVRSIYRWEGRVEEGDEVLMVVKTRATRCEELAARVNDLHPYDVPEVLELAIDGGTSAYLDWVRAESRA
jgi:periplasmic divalent cation tolerance protein